MSLLRSSRYPRRCTLTSTPLPGCQGRWFSSPPRALSTCETGNKGVGGCPVPPGTGRPAREAPLRDSDAHPVVQIAYADAQAFASWAGGRLPTEAELEFAACGGSTPDPYTWGAQRDPDGTLMANTWRGSFPYRNDGALGWRGTSPVASFPPNGYGLYDCIGNVWEWSADRYAPAHQVPGEGSDLFAADPPRSGGGCSCSPGAPEPTTSAAESAMEIPQRVLKGGSHLCAPEYCLRYRPAARSPQAEDSATTHIGFRVARDA